MEEKVLKNSLIAYLQERPVFLALIRAKEAELFRRFLPLRKPVLDFGCGDGFFAKIALLNRVRPLTRLRSDPEYSLIDIGLDLKDSRVEEAKRMGVYKKIVIYDGQRIPFKNNTFSTAVSNCVLEHIPDLENTLSEVYRVLKPKGLFLTSVVAKPWEEYFFGNKIFGDLYKRWMRRKQAHHNMNTLHQWKNLFFNGGFKVLEDIGYLDKKAVEMIDILHYLSLPQLVTYKILGKWVIWKNMIKILPVEYFYRLIFPDLPSTKSGNIFFVLQK